MPGTQPYRERLAVHARQLAFEPHLRLLRQPPRSLLRGLEQTCRSALADHVHRATTLGSGVLIIETWYETNETGGSGTRRDAGPLRQVDRVPCGAPYRCSPC